MFSLNFKLVKNSIVNTIEDTEIKKDQYTQYSFIDYIKNLDTDNVNDQFVVETYNQYLIEWAKINKVSTSDFTSQRKKKYIALLKNIQLNYTTQDEQRILGDIDYDNPLEVEVAIPFFVEKIKDIIEYYMSKRRDVKNSKSKWNTKGNKTFLEKTIAEYISDNYIKTDNTFQTYKQDYQSLSSFRNDYRLVYDGLYDFNDYRSEEIIIDPDTFLSSSGDYELSSLPLSAFSDYTRDSELNDEVKKNLYKKYVSTNSIYYNNGEELAVDSNTPFYSHYNFDGPYISKIADTTNLLRSKDIGYYFTSRYIYTSNYYSPYGITTKDTDTLVGLYPSLDKYYSEDYIDFYYWSKYGYVGQGMADKPVNEPKLKRLYGYQSRDTVINDVPYGIEKYTDNIQLWTGDTHEVWDNEDVFDKFTNIKLNRDEKNDFFFNLNEGEGVFKTCVDIFGNTFSLIKEQKLITTKQTDIYPLATSQVNDTSGLIAIAQTYRSSSPLSGIQMKIDDSSNVYMLGGYMSEDAAEVSTLEDFGIAPIIVYPLLNDRFDTISSTIEPLTSMDYKSIYENQYDTGRVIVRDVNNYIVDPLSSVLTHSIEIDENVINIDIVKDMMIITLTDSIIISKINFDFTTGTLYFTDTNKHGVQMSNYIEDLNKTGSYWYDVINDLVYFIDVAIGSQRISPTIRVLDVSKNTLTTLIDGATSESEYDIDSRLTIEVLSRPVIQRKDKSLFVITLVKDVCGNYLYHVFTYDIITSVSITLVSSNLYSPEYLFLTVDCLSDPTFSSDEIAEIEDAFEHGSNLAYLQTQDGGDMFHQRAYPTASTETKYFYDVDEGNIVSRDMISDKYLLSDITSAPLSTDVNTFTYSCDSVFTPSTITLDFREVDSLVSYVTTSPIIKIKYTLGDKIITKDILTGTDIVVEYDSDMEVSPMNMEYITYNNSITGYEGDNEIRLEFFDIYGTVYTFIFNIPCLSLNLYNQFTKIELLDARVIDQDDQKDLVLYLNTREPNYIMPLTIKNV